MKITPNHRIFITGKTQSGKTTLCKKIIAGIKNVIVYDIKRQYSSLGTAVNNIPSLSNALKTTTKIIYQPFDLSPEHLDEVSKYIFYNLKNLTFVVEEAHKFATKHKIPQFFNSLVTMCEGEPYHIGIIAITQRPANIHNDIISSSSMIICFRLNLESDAQAVTGIPANTIMTLKQYQCAVFDDSLHDNKIELIPKN